MRTLALMGTIAPISVWHANLEVFNVVAGPDAVLAATDGGVAELRGGKWTMLEDFRFGIRLADQPKDVLNKISRSFDLGGGVSALTTGSAPANALPDLPPQSTGTHVTGFTKWMNQEYVAVWGDPSLWRRDGDYSRAMSAPSEGEVYSLSAFGNRLFAGTSQGLWEWKDEAWHDLKIPSQLPAPRIHSMTRMDAGGWLIGSLNGLWTGKPGGWRKIDDNPIRQTLRMGDDYWVVKGSGSLDKFDFKQDRHYTDVLYGSAKRAFASCLHRDGDDLWIGGYGGWIKRGEKQEEVYPDLLKDQVVTAIIPYGGSVWVGTQKGLYRFSPDGQGTSIKGLERAWVSSLAEWKGSLYVGMHARELVRMKGDKPEGAASNLADIRTLAPTNAGLLVGLSSEVHLFDGKETRQYNTQMNETICFSIEANQAAVGTPVGIFHFDLAAK